MVLPARKTKPYNLRLRLSTLRDLSLSKPMRKPPAHMSKPPSPALFLKFSLACSASFLFLCCSSFSSSFLTFAVLILSTCSFLVFSKSRNLEECSGNPMTASLSSVAEISEADQEDEIVGEEEDEEEEEEGPSLLERKPDGPSQEHEDQTQRHSESSVTDHEALLHGDIDDDEADVDQGTTSCSGDASSFSDDESHREAQEWSDDSMSDDESMIEIAIADGHPLDQGEASTEAGNSTFHQPNKREFRQESFSPELLFRNHGLMELLAEINEEDNMIEIDIAMGSIKCSRVGIKA